MNIQFKFPQILAAEAADPRDKHRDYFVHASLGHP